MILNKKVWRVAKAVAGIPRELRGSETRGTVLRLSLPVVSPAYLQRRATVAQARWLLGKHLVWRHVEGRREARVITETEAFDGERDLACHARVGRTSRTEVMYAAGGVWYVYLCYGVHEMLNLVVGPADWPAALLKDSAVSGAFPVRGGGLGPSASDAI